MLNSNKHCSHRSTEVNSNNTELQLLEQDDCFDEDDVVGEEDYDNFDKDTYYKMIQGKKNRSIKC